MKRRKIRRNMSKRNVLKLERSLKKRAKKLRLGKKRTGAYVYGTLRRVRGNPAMKVLGYRSGMQYLTDGKDVYRRDKMDMKHGSMRWYSTLAGFESFIRAYGPLIAPRGLRANSQKGPSDYYYKLLQAGVPMDSHESDLYVKDTPTARAILADWPYGRLNRFKNNINGEIYIDIPFAYAPYWEKKMRR